MDQKAIQVTMVVLVILDRRVLATQDHRVQLDMMDLLATLDPKVLDILDHRVQRDMMAQ